MNDFRARVAKHAALADPARLRIVDLLTLGDFSPTELRAELAMPSNLLSHHLRALEEARAGDPPPLRSGQAAELHAARSPASWTGLAPGGEHPARRVLFVCTPIAPGPNWPLRSGSRVSEIPATSAGTHPADRIAPGAIERGRRTASTLADLPPRRLVAGVRRRGPRRDRVRPGARGTADLSGVHWSVPDPLRRTRKPSRAPSRTSTAA